MSVGKCKSKVRIELYFSELKKKIKMIPLNKKQLDKPLSQADDSGILNSTLQIKSVGSNGSITERITYSTRLKDRKSFIEATLFDLSNFHS